MTQDESGPMAGEGDPDVEALRTELEQIKEAMGIRERYSGATSLWLLLGVLVAVSSGLSQYVHLEGLPAAYHWPIWLVVFGGGFGAWFLVSDEPDEMEWQATSGPNLFLQFAIVYLASIPIQTIARAYTGELGYEAESILALSVIVVVLGVAYGVLGSSMRAYHIRLRDRAVFYVGTGWMVALGTALPLVDGLETWGYAAFGGTYFVYALGAYVFLTRTGDSARGDGS
jgi:hypothetical protein